MQGDVREWPANVSGALDRLLADLAEAREERSRVDTLIRAFAAQDAKTGLNNRLFLITNWPLNWRSKARTALS